MCVMRGLYFLCCCRGYIKFQITITVCQFHWEHGVFRGWLQWMEWILMPIISRYFNNISNIVDHGYLSFKLARPSKSLWFLSMTLVLPIKCSQPGLYCRGWMFCLVENLTCSMLWQGIGEIREDRERLNMTDVRPTWWPQIKAPTSIFFIRLRVWFCCHRCFFSTVVCLLLGG